MQMQLSGRICGMMKVSIGLMQGFSCARCSGMAGGLNGIRLCGNSKACSLDSPCIALYGAAQRVELCEDSSALAWADQAPRS